DDQDQRQGARPAQPASFLQNPESQANPDGEESDQGREQAMSMLVKYPALHHGRRVQEHVLAESIGPIGNGETGIGAGDHTAREKKEKCGYGKANGVKVQGGPVFYRSRGFHVESGFMPDRKIMKFPPGWLASGYGGGIAAGAVPAWMEWTNSAGKPGLLYVSPQNEENQHSGYGNVKPDWKSIAGQSLMLRETRRHRIEEGRQDHGQGDYGKKDMGNEDEKIDGPDKTLAGKTGIAVNTMVNDIADQEQCRENEG